jgi:selenocysteine lyase/cysteine desulfurase
VGIGCAAHIAHSCLHRPVDVLCTDTEVLAMKMHKYFYVSTVEILLDFVEC